MELIHDRKRFKDEVKTCKRCGRDLHPTYPHELCPICMEMDLFNQVKEYIRSNEDVREQDVAEKFNIPIRKVRSWIREGRIQYKGEAANKIGGVVCQICGKPISFGNLCPMCHSLKQLQVVRQYKKPSETAGEMHFIGKEKK